MTLTRREFAKSGLAALGFMALDGLPVFAAPPGWKPNRKPDLVFGVLTDTHLMTAWDAKSVYRTMSLDYIKNAYAYFKKRNVDAVLNLGDAAHRAQVRALEFHREEFDKVFGTNNPPVLLVVDGNHEWQGDWDYLKNMYKAPTDFKENVLTEDFPRLFEKGWRVKYERMWHKEVNGFHFFGRGWHVDNGEFGKFIKSEAERCELKGEKPFFILSHKMTYFACNRHLREYPNAIGFCGHWHTSLANWGNIYFERNYKLFPYINCGACRYDGDNGLDQKWLKEKPASQRDSVDNHFEYPSRQGLVVSVYNSLGIVMERLEFGNGGKLGPDWVFPVGKFETRPYSRETLTQKIGTPEFSKGAKLDVTKCCQRGNNTNVKLESGISNGKTGNNIVVKIPMADGNRKSRVFAYDVVVVADDDPKKRFFKSVYFSGVNAGIGHEPDHGVTTVDIPIAELPVGKKLTVAVRPISSLGTKGKAIATTLRV
jgi:hypothetical protein